MLLPREEKEKRGLFLVLEARKRGGTVQRGNAMRIASRGENMDRVYILRVEKRGGKGVEFSRI